MKWKLEWTGEVIKIVPCCRGGGAHFKIFCVDKWMAVLWKISIQLKSSWHHFKPTFFFPSEHKQPVLILVLLGS